MSNTLRIVLSVNKFSTFDGINFVLSIDKKGFGQEKEDPVYPNYLS